MMRAVANRTLPRTIGDPSPDRVLGLVTENRTERDPSYVDPVSKHWRTFKQRLLLSAAAAIAAVACAHLLIWLSR
jgi:hypothetical protein